MQVYPDGFQGKQLTPVDRNHLTAIAACVWAKNEVRSRQFLNEASNNFMLSTPVKQWSLVVTLAGEKTACDIKLDDGGYFTVSLEYQLV